MIVVSTLLTLGQKKPRSHLASGVGVGKFEAKKSPRLSAGLVR